MLTRTPMALFCFPNPLRGVASLRAVAPLILLALTIALALPTLSLATEDAAPPRERKYLLFNTNGLALASAEQATASMAAIMEHFADLPQDGDVLVGLSAIFSYLNQDPAIVRDRLRHFLAAASATNTPVLIKLDGEQWWGGRPDLWNWWDPERPGYDPENRHNVEWTGWGPEHAMKIAWRNWGRQLRVLPPPNLMSPAYREATREGMDALLAAIMEWSKELPEDKRRLFVGINVGWETSIGYNAYYYPDGNAYLDRPESEDPTEGFDRRDTLARSLIQTGYAAVTSADLRTSGSLTEADLVEVCRRHLADLARHAHGFGFSRDRIFTHGVGNEWGETLYDAARNEWSCPGWSSYWYADDPERDTGIMRNLPHNDAPYWAVAEYLLLRPYSEQDRWQSAFEKTLGYPGCRFLSVYNWEGIHGPEDSRVIEAARRAVRTLSQSTAP